MSEARSLSAEEAAKLLALPTRQRGTSTSSRTTKINIDDRSHPMWWKLPVTATLCTVPSHDEEESERSRMCAKIGDLMVCRYCYTNSRDRTS